MRLRPAFFAVLLVAAALLVAVAAWQPDASAQQPNPVSAIPPVIPIDASQVAGIADGISQRSEHLKPMFDEVHTAEWIAKGAPATYVSQWNSLLEQNQAIGADMTAISAQSSAVQIGTTQPGAMQGIMKAIFRVQRFDRDLDSLLQGVRRYQNPALADLIESVAAGDQAGIEKLEQYALVLANDKDQQLDVVDREAQRCRGVLAGQPAKPPARVSAPKTNPGSSTTKIK